VAWKIRIHVNNIMKPRGKPIKWNPKVAYAVGLLTTDGNLSSDGRHLALVSKDIPLLRIFKKCLGLKNKIGSRKSGYTGKKNCHHVQFGNVIFYKWLLNIGLMPNKTWLLRSLKVPSKYFFDFLRGHLDGDGCIRKFMDPVYPNSQRIYVNFNSASLYHIEWLRKKIESLASIKGFIMKNNTISCLTYAKKESLILLSYLYPNREIPFLKRKYKIAEQFLKPR
jgi:hypothetical protein